MQVDVMMLPSLMGDEDVAGRTAIVFDVLRATTTIIAALDAGVSGVRVFGAIGAAADAAAPESPRPLLCGEVRCVAPSGFDLGNSPRQFDPVLHRGRAVFLATTNGTKALVASRGAATVLVGALVNASAVAAEARRVNQPIVLVCAGTNGQFATEDFLGAGAVLDALARGGPLECNSDAATTALAHFRSSRDRLADILRTTEGGRNVIAAGLALDIDWSARLDATDGVGRLESTDGSMLIHRV